MTGVADRTEQALVGCDEEPIRIPGSVQPHGALLAVTEPDLVVVLASANAGELFGGEVVGRALADLIPPGELTRLCRGLTADLEQINPLRVQLPGSGVDVDLVVHRADGLLITEWEPVRNAGQGEVDWHRRVPSVLQRLSATATLEELAAVLATEVRSLTGFDRVMIYRFDAEWNGEVVAEDRRLDVEPYLGLRFPASDIPAQARALYATNWLRLIPDAGYRPVPLSPAVNPLTGQPLDLSGAMLRSVSPVHLEYLANMDVVASMSVSLIDRGRLWGLISCHHYSGPHRPSYTDRISAEFLGRTASLLLHTKDQAGSAEGLVAVAQRQAQLIASLGRSPRNPAAALTGGEVTVLELLPAAGAAVLLDGRLTLLGATPSAERVVPLVRTMLAAGTPVSDAVSRLVPGNEDLAGVASGILAAEVGAQDGDFLAWFRPETVREVTWGGNPHVSKITEDEDGPRLSPRSSFARWSELVRNTSTPWLEHEIGAAQSLAGHLTEATMNRAEEDNRLAATLQRTLLLEQLPEVPGLDVAARYLPGAHDVVGGDWYDLIPLPSGRVAIVLGDAAGHGLAAASITAQLRHALRAHLLRDIGPAAALQALNELVTLLLPGELATAVVAELDPTTGKVALAAAGHLPVLRLTATSTDYLTGVRGPALGLFDAADYVQVDVQLAGDDRLLLYSDGLIERRAADLTAGLEALRAAAGASATDPSRPMDRLLGDLLATLNPPDADDVTLLGFSLR